MMIRSFSRSIVAHFLPQRF